MVEAGIIHIVNIYNSLSIMMIPVSTTKFWKKKKGLPHFFDKINNIIKNIYDIIIIIIFELYNIRMSKK